MSCSVPVTIDLHPQVSIPFCIPCGMLLWNHRSAKRHIKGTTHKALPSVLGEEINSAFKKCEAAKDEEEAMKNRAVYMRAPFSLQSDEESAPLQSLKYMKVEQGYRCPLCIFYVRKSAVLQDHLKLVHTLHLEESDRIVSSVVQKGTVGLQTLQMGPKTKYFRVNGAIELLKQERDEVACGTDGTLDAKAIATILDIGIAGSSALCDTTEINEEVRMVSAFVDRTKADKILRESGTSKEDAAKLASWRSGRAEDEEKYVFKHCQNYLGMIPDMLDKMSPSLLRKVSLKSEKPFNAVSDESKTAYASVLGRMLVSYIRHGEEKKAFVITTDNVTQYQEGLKSPEQSNGFAMRAMHRVLKEICFERYPEVKGVERLFVRHFIACCSVRSEKHDRLETFRYCEAEEVSGIAAALQYIISCVALYELALIGQMGLTGHSVIASSAEDFCLETEEQVLKFLDVNENTAAGYVRYILNVCTSMIRHVTAEICFSQCERHSLCGFINGVELSMEDQGRYLRRRQTEIEEITSALLFEKPIPVGTRDAILKMPDIFADRKVGFSILKHPERSGMIEEIGRKVLYNLKHNAKGVDRIFLDENEIGLRGDETVSLGPFSLIRRGVERWLSRVQDLQELLLFCMHISSGSPARATELSTYRVQNSSYAQRNIYCSQEDILLLCRYSKQRNIRGFDRAVLRIPDRKTGDLLKQYLVLFRPLESAFVGALFGKEKGRSQAEFLFVERGVPYSPAKIRDVVRLQFAREDKDIGIADYRNHSAAMVRMIARLSANMTEQIVEEISGIGHEQAGHSVATANRVYGRSSLDFPGLAAGEIERYRVWAREFHEALFMWEESERRARTNIIRKELIPEANEMRSGMSIVGKKNMSPRGRDQDNPPRVSKNDISGTQKLCSNLELLSSLETFSKKVTERFNESKELIGCLAKRVGNSCSARENGDTKRRRMVGFWEETGPMLLRKSGGGEAAARALLPHLKKMFRNGEAQFKSQIQADVAWDVLCCKEDILVIMGTGGGKTVSVLLPVLIEGKFKTTVIIVPLTALAEEMVTRCKRYGITVSIWGNNIGPNSGARVETYSQVVLCSAEQVQSTRFVAYIRSGVSSGRIRRVVVDEAHLTVMWEDFRPSMSKIRYILDCINQPIQRVLLSATVPPRDREAVLTSHGMESAVFRMDRTLRQNLKLEVWHQDFPRAPSNYVRAMADRLLPMLKNNVNSGRRVVVFTMSRHGVDTVFSMFQTYSQALEGTEKWTILRYHAGMSTKDRKESHKLWISEEVNCRKLIMIATSAFGAGVDVPDVRHVFHLGGAGSLVQYAQEIGRAGRDGQPASCALLFSSDYAAQLEGMMVSRVEGNMGLESAKAEERKLLDWLDFTRWASSNRCRKSALYEKIDGLSPALCLYNPESINCDVCDVISHAGNVIFHDNMQPKSNQDGHGDDRNSSNDRQRSAGREAKTFPPFPSGDNTIKDEIRRAEGQGKKESAAEKIGGARSADIICSWISQESFTMEDQNQHEKGNGSTKEKNFLQNQLRDVSRGRIWTEYKRICRRYGSLCLPCLVFHQRETSGRGINMCLTCGSKDNSSCFRCMSPDHYTKNCPLPKWIPGHCTKCGIGSFTGISNVHDAGKFGRHCDGFPANKLFWLVWRDSQGRRVFETSFLSQEETKVFQDKVREGEEESDEGIPIQFANRWLHDRVPVPNHIRLVLWACKKLAKLRVSL